MAQPLKKQWTDFLMENASHDGIKSFNIGDVQVFGDVMQEIVTNKNLALHSNLWDTFSPQGSEDRTWYRVFLSLIGEKEYDDMLDKNNMDHDHVQHILDCFSQSEYFKKYFIKNEANQWIKK